MAAMFFQGTLGTFMAYSQIGGSAGSASPGPQGQPPGSHGGGGGMFKPSAPANNQSQQAPLEGVTPRFQNAVDTPVQSGQRGNAPTMNA